MFSEIVITIFMVQKRSKTLQIYIYKKINNHYTRCHFRIQDCSRFNLVTQSLEANLLYFGLPKSLCLMHYLLYVV
jgi:hypothetical protein